MSGGCKVNFFKTNNLNNHVSKFLIFMILIISDTFDNFEDSIFGIILFCIFAIVNGYFGFYTKSKRKFFDIFDFDRYIFCTDLGHTKMILFILIQLTFVKIIPSDIFSYY